MNIPLLRQIQDVIRAKPDEFDISAWHKHGQCNTTHCIGGWSQVLTGAPQNKKSNEMAALLGLEFVKDSNMSAYYEDEQEVIHADDGCEAGRLFYLENWPDKFQPCDLDFCDGGDWKDPTCEQHPYKNRSEAAIARIDHFIETEGRE